VTDPEVTICICTFRRPQMLTALLEALASQRDLHILWEVVVVDNDAAESASHTIARARARHTHLIIRDAVEPVQSIAEVRNRAVSISRGRWIAFIDDDEVPEEGWLSHLILAAGRYHADGVFGPVLPVLPNGTADWIRRGQFFDRPRHASGTVVPVGELRTGNCLISRAVLGSVEGPFDLAFGLSGGEDSSLLAVLRDRGARFLWCDEARVREQVPLERVSLSYLLRRALADGMTHARGQIRVRRGASGWVLALKGLAQLVLGLLAAPFMALRGRHAGAVWLQRAAAGAGKALAVTRLRVERYRRPDGC